ncbi:carbohydrate ABC transporter permease [Paenibacillus contaminans]|uniref:Carbohydrate ABC transporter permease n=1 Tax=Paenibacillus contaminans TaxID=450362 RepID=A0A329LW75_9BACL|nr:carbohydrate ABC transporter permease [Paenibacillus contaminans]RAV12181.1 carbohydrate ABC transporter permease [Paenibacillus contaminans]
MATKKDFLFQFANTLVFLLFALACIYPFYYIFIVSLSSAEAVSRGDVILYPVGFHLDNFKQVFRLEGVWTAFGISAARTVIGTFITLFFSTMLAYICTKQEMLGRKWIYRATVFTMFLQAGLIPWFVTMKLLGLQNTFWLYVLPGMIAPFAVVLIKTYIESIPASLEESAVVDGAGYFTILIKIVVPVSVPIIAAVAVFNAVGQWNSWQDNFFLVNDPKLQTLQLVLKNFLDQAEMLANMLRSGNSSLSTVSEMKRLDPFAVKTTITVVTVLPILCVYPFLQKYFVKGIMLGAVKG